MVPPGDLSGGIEPRPEMVGARRMVVAVPDLVLARPLHPHRSAGHLREDRRLAREVGLGLAPEPAAEESHLALDLGLLDPERFGDVLPGLVRGLGRGDDLHRPRVGVHDRGRGLHRGVDEVRHEVLRIEHLLGGRERVVDVPPIADDVASGAGRGAEPVVVRARVVPGVRAVIPLDRELAAAFEHRPGVRADHRNSAEGPELRGLVVGEGGNLDHLLDALDLERLGRVEGFHLAAVDRRACDDRDLHAGDGHVGPEVGAPGAHVVVVDHRHVAADVLPLRRVLELRRLVAGRDGDVGRRVHHLAEVEGPTRSGVVDAVVLRVHLARVDAPLPGRRLLEHVTPRGAELAHDVQVMTGAAGAVGVLAVLPRRVVLLRIPRACQIFTRCQSASSSSARIIGMPVRTPWPISDRLQVMVTIPSSAMETKRLGWMEAPDDCARAPAMSELGSDLRAEHHRARDAGVLQEVAPAEILYA